MCKPGSSLQPHRPPRRTVKPHAAQYSGRTRAAGLSPERRAALRVSPTRRRAGGDSPRFAGRSGRYAQPLHRSGDWRHDCRMPLSSERQSGAGTEIRIQAALVRTADGLRQSRFAERRSGRAGRRLTVDRIRDRFGSDAIGYASVALGISRSVPDEFRKLAEKDL
jgi:hypothetical protein